MKKIGPYNVLAVLAGGVHPLYKVEGPDSRVLALKTLATQNLAPDDRARFERESQVGSQLAHRNLLQVLDFGEADGFMYQATELLNGADLATVLAKHSALSWPQRIGIMKQVCEGLEYAHARDLVHRDLKPANIFVEQSGQVRILDFGLVRTESSNLTQAGMAVGTLSYMAPEQVRGAKCTPATDVFAFGVVCYELASGVHPFTRGKTDLSGLLTDILFTNPAPLRQVAADAPEWLEAVLDKMMAKAPEARPQNAGEVRALLTAAETVPSAPRAAVAPAAAAAPPPPAPAPKPAAAPAPVTRPVPAAPSGPRAPSAQTPAKSTPPRPARQTSDADMTVVMSRPKDIAPRPAASRPAAPTAPRLSPRKRGWRSKFGVKVYCLSCTYANPLGVSSCQQCGRPLEAETIAAAARAAHRRAQIWWIAAAGVVGLAVILGVVMVFMADKL